MLAHKLVLDDDDEQSFKLIALHSSVEEYRLAYLLNKHLDLRLARTRKDLDFDNAAIQVVFGLYKFYDPFKYCGYYLISNKATACQKPTKDSGGLFKGEEWETTNFHLLPEFQRVDYFLKIEEEVNTISEKLLLEKLKEIPQLATAYVIEYDQIKTKENLIFD